MSSCISTVLIDQNTVFYFIYKTQYLLIDLFNSIQ